MSVTNLLDFLAVKVDSTIAQHTPFTMNVIVPDLNEIHFIEMSNGNLNNGLVAKAKKADATITINKADITNILLEKTTLATLMKNEKVTITDDAKVLDKLMAASVEFDTQFEIVPRPAKDQKVDEKFYHNN